MGDEQNRMYGSYRTGIPANQEAFSYKMICSPAGWHEMCVYHNNLSASTHITQLS